MMNRRMFIRDLLHSSTTLFSTGLFLTGCGRGKSNEKMEPDAGASNDPCSDLSGVSENDLELRTKFAYVKESPIVDNQCSNCNLYLPPKEGGACGGCLLFKGPVYPSGYCTYWAPKV